MGDPVDGPFDVIVLWFSLPRLAGMTREEAIDELEAWLNRRGNRRNGNHK